MSEVFADRSDAGPRLAGAVLVLKRVEPVVLALPRGGVLVALAVGRALRTTTPNSARSRTTR